MSKTAIIAEFNPLHNGHCHIIKTAQELGDVIVVMSGGFVQRGEAAVLDKYTRAKHAITAGADLVVELPPPFAFSSAQYFAEGGVKCAAAVGADTLIFGSESGIVPSPQLQNTAAMHESLNRGDSYAKAISAAIGNAPQPNDILALEYVNAINTFAPNIKPLAILRKGAGYDSSDIIDGMSSSSAVRAALQNGKLTEYDIAVAPYVMQSLLEVSKDAVSQAENTLFKLLKYRVKTEGAHGIADTFGMSEGLENRIYNTVSTCESYSNFFENLKTKRYTMSRLKRLCLAIVLRISKSDFEKMRELQFINVLALKKEKSYLLNEFSLPKVTKFQEQPKNEAYSLLKKCDAAYETLYNFNTEYCVRIMQ